MSQLFLYIISLVALGLAVYAIVLLHRPKPQPLTWEQVKSYIDQHFATQKWVRDNFVMFTDLESTVKELFDGLIAEEEHETAPTIPPPAPHSPLPPPPLAPFTGRRSRTGTTDPAFPAVNPSQAPLPPIRPLPVPTHRPSGATPPPPPPPPIRQEDVEKLRDRSSRAVMSVRELFIFVSHAVKVFQGRFKAPLEAQIRELEAESGLDKLKQEQEALEDKLSELEEDSLPEHPSEDELNEELRYACKGITGVAARVDAQQQYLQSREEKRLACNAQLRETQDKLTELKASIKAIEEGEAHKVRLARIAELQAGIDSLGELEIEMKKVESKLNRHVQAIPLEEMDELAASVKSLAPPPDGSSQS